MHFKHFITATALVLGLAVPESFRFSVAQAAPVDLIFTPFTGDGIVSTNLTSVGNQTVPWTDAFGRTYSGGISIISPFGWFFANNPSLTISNLGPDIDKVGFRAEALGLATAFTTLTSVSFNNGESYLTPLSIPNNEFRGFQTTTPFTSVTFTFAGVSSAAMRDFITQTTVPEPSTIVSGLLCVLCVGVTAYRKRRGRSLANA